MKFGLDAFRDYFTDVATFPIVPADIADPYAFLIESGAACIGTPDDAIAYIERLRKGSGGFGAIMELAHNWADWEATKRHYELMARYRAPALPALARTAARCRTRMRAITTRSSSASPVPRCRRRSIGWRRGRRPSSPRPDH